MTTDSSSSSVFLSEMATDLAVGLSYVTVGTLGIACNMATVVMIATNRVYRLSAYTLMANIALCDSLMLLVAGLACGWSFVERSEELQMNTNSTFIYPLNEHSGARFVISTIHISAWTAGVLSYALLGINRCIAIRYYGTRAKAMNRMPVAIVGSLITWAIGLIAALAGTFPEALMGIRQDMYTLSMLDVAESRASCFFYAVLSFNLLAISAQWFCSVLVLLKIRYVKQKISRNKLNQNSANRFRRQAKLTFQFFYPSLLCTLSSVILFTKPFLFERGLLSRTTLIVLHLVWLVNHTCNPFIYAYFNERMRLTYRQLMTCAQLRRSNGAKSNRMSTRSARGTREPNFVRNSLQMQSRDFEQLCEFMMRVNPFYDSSEGWRESSDDEDDQPQMLRELAESGRHSR